MVLRWLLASLHLLALPIGLAAVWTRGRALRAVRHSDGLNDVFRADNAWGLAAVLWLATGLWRLLGATEKATSYYLHDRVFYTKVALFLLILLLELAPMATLIRWRIALRRGAPVDTSRAPAFARISQIQAALVLLMVFLATALARGFFY